MSVLKHWEPYYERTEAVGSYLVNGRADLKFWMKVVPRLAKRLVTVSYRLTDVVPGYWRWHGIYHYNIDLFALWEQPQDYWNINEFVDVLVHDYSNSTANALELLQSCSKSSV